MTSVLILLLAVLPFERWPVLQQSGFDLRLSTAVALILVIAAIINAPKQLHWQKLLSSERIAVILVLWALLSVYWAGSAARALHTALALAFTVAVAMAVRIALHDKLVWPKAKLVLGYVALGVALIAFYQFIAGAAGLSNQWTLLSPVYAKSMLGFPRPHALSLEPLYFGNFLCFLLPVPLILVEQQPKRRLLWLTTFGLALVSFFLPISRSANLGLVVGLVIVSTLLWFRQERQLTTRLWLATVAAVLLAAGLYVGLSHLSAKTALNLPRAEEQLLIGDLHDPSSNSTVGRLDNWSEALRLGQTVPLSGVGMGNFGNASTLPQQASQAGQPIVNNLYLELFAELGIVGLVLGLGLFVSLAAGLARSLARPKLDRTALWLLFSLMATIVQYMFFSTLYILPIWVMIGFIWAHIRQSEPA